MTEYISKDDLSILQPASTLAEVSAGARLYHELHSIARACNLAANTGESSVLWDKPISDENRQKLEDNGYKLTQDDTSMYPSRTYTISWSQSNGK